MLNPVYLKESSPSLPSRTDQEVGRRVTADRLVTTHGYLCRRGARKFWRRGLERCDLEQVAAIGLIKASRRYDAASATPFEAYAWLTIIGELMHYVRDNERIVRIPRRLKSFEPHFNRAQDICTGRLGREPTDSEMAAEMGVVEHTIAEVRRARASAAMLPLEDPCARAVPDRAIALEDRVLVDAAFRRLSTLERRIIVGTYILRLNSLELGQRLGVSPRRVGRIRLRALERMQTAWIT